MKKGRLAGRLPGVHLNKKGREQAQKLAEALALRFKDSPVKKTLYSSPMERAMETAEPVAQALGLEIIQRQGLIEVDVGEWQDRTLKSLSRLKQWRIVQRVPSLWKFPGGESFAEAQFRITQELNELAASHDEKEVILAVTHSDPIKLAVAYYLGMPLDCFQRMGVSPASISGLFLSGEGAHLLMLNVESSIAFPQEEAGDSGKEKPKNQNSKQ